jgi:hypothetical protein
MARKPGKTDLPALHADQARATQAKALLDNPLLKDAFNAVDDRFVRMIVNSRLNDVEGRELVHKLLVASKELKAQLIHHINTGKLADFDVKAMGEHDGA